MDLSSLTSDDLKALRIALGLPETANPYGWSPQFSKGVLASNPRQLLNLTLPPRADDPRPTFFPSAEPPRDGTDLTKTTPYPRLMWHGVNGVEITVANKAAEVTATASGYVVTPPANAVAPDPQEQVREALAALSPEDRKTVIQAAQGARLARVQELTLGLTDDQLDALVASISEPRRK